MKYFAIVFFSVNILYMSVDAIFRSSLPTFINLKILFLFYSFMESVGNTIAIVILSAFILTMRRMIQSNELVTLLSFGYHKRTMVQVFCASACLIVFCIIAINTTDLAYATDRKNVLVKQNRMYQDRENVFLKHNNTYVYFKKLIPSNGLALDVKIFEFDEDLRLNKVYYAEEALYKQNFWILEKAEVIYYPKENHFETSKLVYADEVNVRTLEEFRPNIINTMYEKSIRFSIPDALTLLSIFDKQNINTNKARSSLYQNLVLPFYPVLIIILLFYYTPSTSRLANMSKYNFVTFLTALIAFGMFQTLDYLSYHASGYNTEIFSLAPFTLLAVFSGYKYWKLS